jgi:methylmalonyl-CoA/ethylmalonyl-CoA epimerase
MPESLGAQVLDDAYGLARMRRECSAAQSSLRRLRDCIGGSLGHARVPAMLAERAAALLGELSWELGVTGPQSVAETGEPRLDHVGIAVRDLGSAAALYGTLLGGRLVAGGMHAELGVRSAHYAFAGGGKLELLQPLAGSPVAEFIARRGEGVHHLTFFVGDLPRVVTALESAQRRVVGQAVDDPSWQEAYISPHSAHGCVVQLVAGHDDLPPVEGMTIEQVLQDKWNWVDHRPVRAG